MQQGYLAYINRLLNVGCVLNPTFAIRAHGGRVVVDANGVRGVGFTLVGALQEHADISGNEIDTSHAVDDLVEVWKKHRDGMTEEAKAELGHAIRRVEREIQGA